MAKPDFYCPSLNNGLYWVVLGTFPLHEQLIIFNINFPIKFHNTKYLKTKAYNSTLYFIISISFKLIFLTSKTLF